MRWKAVLVPVSFFAVVLVVYFSVRYLAVGLIDTFGWAPRDLLVTVAETLACFVGAAVGVVVVPYRLRRFRTASPEAG